MSHHKDLAVEGHAVVGQHQNRGKSVVSKSMGSRDDKLRLPRGTPDSGAVPAVCVYPSPSLPKQASEGTGAAKSSPRQAQRSIRIPIQGADSQPLGDSSIHNSPRVGYHGAESVGKKSHCQHPSSEVQELLQKSNTTTKKLTLPQGQRALGHPLVDLHKRDSPIVAQGEQGYEECEPPGREEREEEGEEKEVEWRGELVGSAARVQFHNPRVAMLLSRKLDGHLVRRAEAEIVSIRAAQTVPRIPPSSHLLLKDDLDFRRVHDSMGLTALQTVEKAYRQRGKEERLRAQKQLVSRKQALRQEIKEKIAEHHQRRLDEVARWKQAHCNFVARAREHSIVEGDLRSSLHQRDINCQQFLKMEQRAEEGFVSQFRGINSSMGNSLKQEDNRLLREEQQTERTNSVQQLRKSNFITRAMVLSQQQEKAEATRLRSADMRNELMKLKHKKVTEQYIAAKQKVEAVKHSLHPRTSRETHKMQARLTRSKGTGPLSPPSAGAVGVDPTAPTCSVDLAPCGTLNTGTGSIGPKVVTIDLEDYGSLNDPAVFLRHSLPPGRIIRHYSFVGGNEGNPYEDPLDLDFGIRMVSMRHTSDATLGPSMTLSALY